MKKVAEHIVAWMADYAQGAGSKGFVVGVSGGIDSAVTSALAARTGLPTTLVEMPIHQPDSQVNRAWEHIENLKAKYPNVKGISLQLTSVFDQMISTFESTEREETTEMSLVNTRARLRMTSLYFLASNRGALVAGTGNKIEDFGVGFYTKYGDGGVDISPIADCTKSQVWAMGKELNILEDIQVAEPTDGLWSDGRTDTDQLGMSYKEIEFLMERPNEPEYKKYLEIRKKNLHKMKPIPVCKFDGKASLETD